MLSTISFYCSKRQNTGNIFKPTRDPHATYNRCCGYLDDELEVVLSLPVEAQPGGADGSGRARDLEQRGGVQQREQHVFVELSP